MKAMNGILAICFSTLLLATACGEDDHGEDPDVEGCEHLEQGPFNAVGATAEETGAPSIATAHTGHVVTLVPVTGGNGGVVSYPAAEATDYLFFLNADVPVVFKQAGAAVTPEAVVKSSPACAAIKARYLVPLAVGPVTLTLGPTTATQVSIVVEEAAHEDDDAH